MNRQEFIDKYLDTIIKFRRDYLLLEKKLENATASEVLHITQLQNDLCKRMIIFIIRPKSEMGISEQKLIDEILSEH